jgi:hypothetical protein
MISINGAAAEAYTNMKGGKRTRKAYKGQQGGDEVPGPMLRGGAAYAPVAMPAYAPVAMPASVAAPASTPAPAPAPVITTPGHMPQKLNMSLPAIAASVPQPQPQPQQGGKRLVLAPKKKSRISLAPPSGKHANKVGKTRKIRMQISGLKKRLTKAKIIRHQSREKPIEEVRKLLEEAKLIKPLTGAKNTVPDSVLRGIWNDYELLRNRAL